MAKPSHNNKSALCILIILSLLLVFNVAESRPVFRKLVKEEATLTCAVVFGVKKGDTCFKIAQGFGLTSAEFNSINPNLNCAALFIGQWLCVDHET